MQPAVDGCDVVAVARRGEQRAFAGLHVGRWLRRRSRWHGERRLRRCLQRANGEESKRWQQDAESAVARHAGWFLTGIAAISSRHIGVVPDWLNCLECPAVLRASAIATPDCKAICPKPST